jgi:lipoate-protein ligase A
VNTVQNTPLNSPSVQYNTDIEHQLALEKLKNEHLSQQVIDQKKLIENYQQQIAQLNKTLDKANASIQDFAQVRLLEFKKSEQGYEPPLELEKEKTDDSTVATVEKKKRWWEF